MSYEASPYPFADIDSGTVEPAKDTDQSAQFATKFAELQHARRRSGVEEGYAADNPYGALYDSDDDRLERAEIDELEANLHSDDLPLQQQPSTDVSIQTEVQIYGSQRHPLEHRLEQQLPDIIERLNPNAVMVPSNMRDGTIRYAELFNLIPIMGLYGRGSFRTLSTAGASVELPPGITCSYRSGSVPYLDTQHGIGLTYGSHVIAVAGAGINDAGQLIIRQLQDVTNVRKDKSTKSEYYSTGLHNGLDWRRTLVNSWETVAVELGIDTVGVQGHVHNLWPKARKYGHGSYDAVAERMDYQQLPDGNWVKQLSVE